MGLKFYSQNVRGMRDYEKRRKIYTYFKEKQVDILCLQETFSVKTDEKFWKSEWGGLALFSHGVFNSRGVSILFRRNLDVKIIDVTKDFEGRFIVCSAKINGKNVVISNLYAPNEDRPEFFVEVFRHLRNATSPEWIVGGDFNLTLCSFLDRRSTAKNVISKKASETLKEFMNQHFLIDIWREQHPNLRRYTWHGRINLASRIDFVLISASLLSKVIRSDVLATTISDHSALFLEIDLIEEKRGRGFWKFNESHLKNKDFIHMIQKSIDEVVIKNSHERLDPLMNWEMIKNQVIGDSIKYSFNKAKDKQKILNDLNETVNSLEAKLDQCSNDLEVAQIYEELINAKNELDLILIEKTARVIHNTKSRWYNEGEASTKYFFNLEKQKYVNSSMDKIELDDGTFVTERKKILAEQKKFYEQVYTSNPAVTFTKINSSNERILTQHEKMELETTFTHDEIYKALMSMETGKTPGTDGLGPAFYSIFWDKLGSPLGLAYNYAFRTGLLHSSARRGILSLIPKKGRNLLKVKNWRPITLLNTDYKILSKVIANRIKMFLPKLISTDQTGFMKGRNISTNIRKIIDIDDYCSQQEIDAIILSVDFERCFDTIEISSIDKILEYFNFGRNIRTWVKLLFKEMRVCTLNYGYSSDYFTPTRGLFQGNPISSYLYLLTGQILNDCIANNKDIIGIPLGQSVIKSIQFADDLNLPLMFDQRSLDAVLCELVDFEKQVGLKINLSKSVIYRIGAIAKSTCLLNSKGIPWTNGPIKVLGINIDDTKCLERDNIEPMITKMQAVINTWKNRDLSLVGKALIINSLVMSLLVYRLSVLPKLSDHYIKRLHGIWSEFIWDGKKPKISWKTLTAPKANGGLGLSHLEKRDQSLKIQWVSIYIKDQTIKFLADWLLGSKIGELLWSCNLKSNDVGSFTANRGFWHDVLKSWCLFNYSEPIGYENVVEQVLWFNSHVRIAGRLFFSQQMFASGIVRVKDLLFDDTSFFSCAQFSRKYPSVNLLDYLSLVSALPQLWKNWIKAGTPSPELFIPKIELTNQYSSIVAIAYRSLHTNVYLLSEKINKWERIFDIALWPQDFRKIVTAIWAITNFSKLRSFQYKVLNHAVITNIHLKYWKIKDENHCTFCKNHSETLVHLLCECEYVIKIWDQVKTWCANLETQLMFDSKSIVFNNVHKNPKNVINVLVLIVKYYVYCCRCASKLPNVYELTEVILYHNRMEYFGAIMCGKKEKCKVKWEPLLEVLKI